MKVILSIVGRGMVDRVAKNVVTSVTSIHPKSNPIEIEPITIDGRIIRRFEAEIRRCSGVCDPVDVLCEEFGYISCIEWEQCFYASIPSDDEDGWEAELVDVLAVRAGFASGKYFRSFTKF